MSWRHFGYKPYVPVAQRRAQAAKEIAKRLKKGESASPISIEGRKIASTFWGQAWCTNLESYSDFANRLPRGRSYVRNGSVVHLAIAEGKITAFVSGSEVYKVEISIAALPKRAWTLLKEVCAGKIGSLVELLQGKLSSAVMEAVTDRDQGLFPKPKEIELRCSCPDYAGMCKHVAAVMYGVGNRLDTAPELLFALRGLDHRELIEQAIPSAPVRAKRKGGAPTIADSELGAIFDIEIGDAASGDPPASSAAKKPAKAKTRRTTAPKPTGTAVAKAKKAGAYKNAGPSKKSAAGKAKAARASRKG